jgi:uncharacterized membrane protein YgcG
VPAGDGFSPAQRQRIDRAIREAETVCRFEFSVYVGPAEGDPASFAQRLHAALVAPDRSVLLMVDPAQRALEVVTGSEVRRELPDNEVALAVAEMQADFAHDDLCAGLVHGINMLAEHARRPPMLHAQER